MDLHGFADMRTFWVRLPKPFYPYRGRESIETCEQITQIEACEDSDVPPGTSDWLGNEDLAQFFPSKCSEKNPLNIPARSTGRKPTPAAAGQQRHPAMFFSTRTDRSSCSSRRSVPTSSVT